MRSLQKQVTIETLKNTLTTENRKVGKTSNRKMRKKKRRTLILRDSFVKYIAG